MPRWLKVPSAHPVYPLHHLGSNGFPCLRISWFPRRFYSQRLWNSSLTRTHSRRLYSINSDYNAHGLSDSHDTASSLEHEGVVENDESAKESVTSNEMLKRLKRYGISGILSYGLLNTAYYLTTFLLVWFYVAPAPAKMGYFAAVERFIKVMAMVWAGSQVTKLVRAAGALALAPIVDTGLSWFTVKFKFESQGKAFMTIVGFCFGLAIILFFVVTMLWA